MDIDRELSGRESSTNAWLGWLTGALIAVGFLFAGAAAAQAETRTLKLYNLHTKERAEITFKRNGRYDSGGLKKANMFLRDWRRNEPTKIDPRLLDLVWEAYRAAGARDYIHVVSSYRSPATNSMLRGRSKGVAEKSQHMLGKAMDFFIPGVKLANLRAIGLKMGGGGVGYYPRSGSPFVHMDVGNVRHWPKMSRKELVAIFPKGGTMHVPSDGKPLPGYQQAVAAYNARKKNGAPAMALASTGGGSRPGNLLAALFGGGADEAEDEASVDEAPAPKAKTAVAAAKPVEQPVQKKVNGKITILPPELASPAQLPAEEPQEAAEPESQTPETIIAALPSRKIPLPGFAPRPQADVGAPVEVAMNAPVNMPFGVSDASQDQLAVGATADAAPAGLPFGTSQATAEELAGQDAAAELAYGIPTPTWRPDETTASTPSALTLAALAAAGDDLVATDAGVPLPAARPSETGEFSLASLPEKGPALVSQEAPGGLFGASGKTTRVAALVTGVPSPRQAARPADAKASAAVKTTRKANRPDRNDGKPDAKPIVVAAQPHDARWAFENNEAASVPAGATAGQKMAFDVVRTAPTEIYTAGFQAGDDEVDFSRFAGKAVTFMSVAKFHKN